MKKTAKNGELMLSEIKQIPGIAERLIDAHTGEIAKNAKRIGEAARNGVYFAARGTSDNACSYGKYLFEILLGIPASLAAPSVATLYKKKIDLKGRLVVGVSQSGESIDVCEYLQMAKKSGALVMGLTNVEDSTLAKISDVLLPLACGEEKAVAATKTYVASLLLMRMVAAAIAGKRPYDEALLELPELMNKTFEHCGEIERVVPYYRYMSGAVCLGRGFNYSSAQEFSLKLMETTYTPVHPFSFADFMHGPVALMHEGLPTFAFLSDGPTAAPMRKALDNLRARGGESIVITNMKRKAEDGERVIVAQKTKFEFDSPMTMILPAYLFAHKLALARNYNPDAPRGLTKVTKTR
jgi:glucosamine--fructose-6-phosphate aminotransferase (isomerizing)